MGRSGFLSRITFVIACMTMLFGMAPVGGAIEDSGNSSNIEEITSYQGLSELERIFERIDEKRRNLKITLKESVLQKAGAFYEGDGPGLAMKCDKGTREMLEGQLLDDAAEVAYERGFSKSDDAYLRGLSQELSDALDKPLEAEMAPEREPPPPEPVSSCHLVEEAEKEGRLTRKEAVMLEMKLIYAPRMISAESEFAPKPGARRCPMSSVAHWQGNEIDSVLNELTPDEKELLQSLDPFLKDYIDGREKEKSGLEGVAPGASESLLPNLDKTYEGETCVVHYTLNVKDKNHVATNAYAQRVATYADQAIKSQTAAGFRVAYPEGGGKLQIYCVDRSANGDWGQWIDKSDVPGYTNRRAGYIIIDHAVTPNSFLALIILWSMVVCGAGFPACHLHRNGRLESLPHMDKCFGMAETMIIADYWFQEAAAMWAQKQYGGDSIKLKYYFE